MRWGWTIASVVCALTNARPNLVLVHLDDVGYGDVSSYSRGNNARGGARTPRIDRLAEEGTRFTSYYSAACVCTPSRAGLLTGRYPIRTGAFPGVLGPDDEIGLPLGEITLAKWLKDKAGYRTFAVGKWHLGHLAPFLPTSFGFDTWLGMPYSHDYCPCPESLTNTKDSECRDFDPPCPLMNDTLIVQQPALLNDLVDRYVESALDQMRDAVRANQPFFLYYACHHTHHPQFVKKENVGKSAKSGGRSDAFGDAAWEMDAGVGRLVDFVLDAGIKENTYVLVTSDNGAAIIYGEFSGSNAPLRCGKGTTWEGGQRVPFIVWGADTHVGRVVDDVVAGMDVFPTLIRLAGIDELPTDRIIDGIDFADLFTPTRLASSSRKRTSFIYYSLDPGSADAVRVGDYKVHFKTNEWQDNMWSHKTCHPFNLRAGVLDEPLVFDVRNDLGESRPLPAADPNHKDAIVKATQLLAEHACSHVGQASCRASRPMHCIPYFGLHHSVPPWPPSPFIPWVQSGRACCSRGYDILLPDFTKTHEFTCVPQINADGKPCSASTTTRSEKIDSLCNPSFHLFPTCEGRAVCQHADTKEYSCADPSTPHVCSSDDPENAHKLRLVMCAVGFFQCRQRSHQGLDVAAGIEETVCVAKHGACDHLGGVVRGARACGLCVGERIEDAVGTHGPSPWGFASPRPSLPPAKKTVAPSQECPSPIDVSGSDVNALITFVLGLALGSTIACLGNRCRSASRSRESSSSSSRVAAEDESEPFKTPASSITENGHDEKRTLV